MHRASTRWLAEKCHTWSLAPSLRRTITAEVAHVHWIGTGWELSGFAVAKQARRLGIPFTVLPAIHPGAWGDSAFDFSFYARADAVLALSDGERTALIAGGVPPERVHRVVLAPSVSPSGNGRRLRTRLGLGDERLVLFVGRRDAYKGYDVLRRAMVDVWAVHPDVRALACGPGDLPAGDDDPRLIDLGLVDEATKADAYAAADMFCLPSRFESFGIAFVEAWSYGLAVISGDSPAAAELIREGRDGLVVTPTVDAVGGALLRLLADDEVRVRMGAAGRARQRAEFTWARVADRHERVFAQAGTVRRAAATDASAGQP